MEDYKQKYEEALGRARTFSQRWQGIEATDSELALQEVKEIFPELKESEDERIRKYLIGGMKHLSEKSSFFTAEISKDKVIAWLEKQGKKSHCNGEVNDETLQKQLQIWFDKGKCSGRDEVIFHPENFGLQKQCEQKTTDKVEPKFHEGEWITIDNPCQIISIDGNYIVQYCDDETTREISKKFCESQFHTWTIQDAKDGDVISFNDGHGNDCIELIKSITGKKIEFWFCLTNGNCYEVFDGIIPYTNFASRKDATPATKEQRDLLFSKMKEAGYKWDAEKKELNKIEQKPSWSEEDEKMCQETIDWFEKKCFPYALESENPARESIKWLKCLKERIQPQLKQDWKPSDEQMEALLKLEEMHVLEHEKNQENAHLYMVIKSLKEQLLKLKEE